MTANDTGLIRRPVGHDESGSLARRLVWVFVITNTVGYGALIQTVPVLLLPMARDLDTSRTAIAGATTLAILVSAVAAIPVGTLLDRYGGRALMSAGSAIGVVGVVVCARAEDQPTLYGAFVLIGLALAMSTYEAAFAVLVVATEASGRDRAFVVVTMLTGLGTSLYYPLTGWLESQLGWRTTLLVLAASLALVALPAHLWALPGRAAHARRIVARTGLRVGHAVRSVRFWLLLLGFVAQAGATSAFLVAMVTYFRDIGFSAGVASSLPLAVGLLQITSRLALAPLAARFGMGRVTAASFAIQGAGLLALPLAGTSVPSTLACVACFGLGYGVSVVARPSIVADVFGVAHFASILAVMTAPMALSRAGAPLGAVWLGDWRFLVAAGAMTLLSAAALIPVARRGHSTYAT
ncbi:MFS transporter [Nocardioides sp. NPDC059952]|uniref:MFS transporter n=1 Tax=Nocardioides sp. NPDC059952 TaxID=3347014 RepID=UPI00365B1201